MPWTCKECQHEVEADDLPECPGCGAKKTAWTMVSDQTRTFAMAARRKVEILRGVGREPLEGEGASYEGMLTEKASEAVSMEKEALRWLAEDGALPPPDQLLVVRLSAPRAPEVEVFLSVEFETREVAEHRVVAEATPGEALDVRFLLVHGPRALPEDLTLPDVHLVDASEETRLGHAPQVGVRAVTRRRKQLPLKTGLRAFVWST